MLISRVTHGTKRHLMHSTKEVKVWFLVVVIWLVCGMLAQGMCRYNYSKTLSPTREPESFFFWFLFIMGGPLGLPGVVHICILDKTWGLKF